MDLTKPEGVTSDLFEVWPRLLIDFEVLYEQRDEIKKVEELHDAMHPGEQNLFSGIRSIIEGIIAAGFEDGVLSHGKKAATGKTKK